MTSGTFRSFPAASIIFQREARQRTEITGIEELAKSIATVGLINPIVVQQDGTLVAGERRLTAIRSLGWTHVPVQFAEDLDERALHLIELEENIKREQLSWQDEVRAMERYHQLQLEADPEWTSEKTATALNSSPTTVSKTLRLAPFMKDPEVAGAETISVARGRVDRKIERAKAAEVAAITKAPKATIVQNVDFNQWAPNYSGSLFTLIHCDFPYGVGMHNTKQGNQDIGLYQDTPEIYEELLSTFVANFDRFAAPSCHVMFWYSMTTHAITVEALSACGLTVIPYPLIWFKSDNSGVLSDPQRRPRHVYETALYAYRGEARVVKSKSDVYAAPIEREFHQAEKPVSVIRHFFDMLVDEHTSILDPTAGSGTALRVAKSLGASHILGLEINPDYVEQANMRLA